MVWSYSRTSVLPPARFVLHFTHFVDKTLFYFSFDFLTPINWEFPSTLPLTRQTAKNWGFTSIYLSTNFAQKIRLFPIINSPTLRIYKAFANEIRWQCPFTKCFYLKTEIFEINKLPDFEVSNFWNMNLLTKIANYTDPTICKWLKKSVWITVKISQN